MTKLSQIQNIPFRSVWEGMILPEDLRRLDKLAPERLEVPSGSRIRLDYSDPDQVSLSVKLQELFGLQETPRIAGGRVAILMDILSPAMRTVQKTKDLKSFWDESYFLVRKEMRGRYPKHDWPENPREAIAHKGTRKKG